MTKGVAQTISIYHGRRVCSMKPIRLSSRFDQTLAFAVDLHRKQPRKGTRTAYVAHVLGTSAGRFDEQAGREAEVEAAALNGPPQPPFAVPGAAA